MHRILGVVLALSLLVVALLLAYKLAGGFETPQLLAAPDQPAVVGRSLDDSAAIPPPCGWNLISSPSPSNSGNFLYGVAARTANDVWAVGSSGVNSQPRTLTLHWDGTSWTQIPSPNGGASTAELESVAVVSSDDVWAVGYYGTSTYQTLTEHWNGTTWSIVPNPPLTGDQNILYGVVAIGTNDVWAVGYQSTSTVATLALHWDGTAWSVVASPNPYPAYWNSFQDITAAASNDVWAVGYGSDSVVSSFRTLVEHWDGAQWSVVPSPNATIYSDQLTGVAAVAANDVWATGGYLTPPDRVQTLTMHWDGSAWTIVPSPSPNLNSIFGTLKVAAAATNDVWAVGSYFTGAEHTLALHWDGAAWTQVATLDPYPDNYLNVLAVVAANDVWAVGNSGPAGVPDHTLIEHYTGPCATATPTATGTPPTATATATPITCSADGNYLFAGSAGATIVPGVADTGNHCDDCTTAITLPFPVGLYSQTFTTANVSSNGNLQFVSNDPRARDSCLPDSTLNYAILPFWSDMTTTGGSGGCYMYAGGCGIFTSFSGTAPNRIFNIEWRAVSADGKGRLANFELRLYENSAIQEFDLIYGVVRLDAGGQTVGVQQDTGSHYTLFTCQLGGVFQGLQLTFTRPPCGGASPTPPAGTPTTTHTPGTTTATRTATTGPSNTPIRTVTPGGPTNTASATITPGGQTSTASATSTVCPIQFSDVPPNDPFYPYIRCLTCRGILSGYSSSPPCAAGSAPCFNGGANITRGQTAKIVANAAGYTDPIPSTQQTFTDVPYGSPFWLYVERAALHGVISGYSTSPPCIGGVPCFLPGNPVTRGQMAKIDTIAGNYQDPIPSTQQTFTDVPYGSPFWVYVERAVVHGVISGYTTSPPCAGGVPCFLPGNVLTRNQGAKIVANTFYPNCQTPAH